MSEGSEVGPERPHLVANDVDLVLHLRNPLTHNGKELWDGGARIHQDLQTGGVIGVKEGKGCRGHTMGEGFQFNPTTPLVHFASEGANSTKDEPMKECRSKKRVDATE